VLLAINKIWRFMRLSKSLLVLPLIIASLSVTAGARENHCDHNGGKTGGAIGGAIIGGIIGGLIDHGHAGGIALGAGGGALAGGVIGDNADDQNDFNECGTDAASFQRQVDRDQTRSDDRADREARRQDEIRSDRDQEIERRDDRWRPRPVPRPYPHRQYPPPRYPPPRYPPGRYIPRNDGVYQCQTVGYGYSVVYRPWNQIVRNWGGDLDSCYRDADQRSYGY
jgi:hypothetical protein